MRDTDLANQPRPERIVEHRVAGDDDDDDDDDDVDNNDDDDDGDHQDHYPHHHHHEHRQAQPHRRGRHCPGLSS